LAILCLLWYHGNCLAKIAAIEMAILKESHLTTTDKPLANPLIVLREEFDDWAILFDPDTGHAYGLNPVSVFIWKHLDGKHTMADILENLQAHCEEMPEEAEAHIREFIDNLLKNGLAGYEHQT
jgi:SynChlorMet cassette protein ScmD